MNTSKHHLNHDSYPQPQALTELTIALEKIIQELAIASPQTISIFFDGTEVYRQHPDDGSVFWWQTDDNSTEPLPNQIALLTLLGEA